MPHVEMHGKRKSQQSLKQDHKINLVHNLLEKPSQPLICLGNHFASNRIMEVFGTVESLFMTEKSFQVFTLSLHVSLLYLVQKLEEMNYGLT